jgi:hypothetical protein
MFRIVATRRKNGFVTRGTYGGTFIEVKAFVADLNRVYGHVIVYSIEVCDWGASEQPNWR